MTESARFFLKTMEIFVSKLHTADYIQIAILIALIWYSLETYQLRKWQKKQAQLTLLGLDMQRVRSNSESRGNPTPYGEDFPIIVRKIYEQGKFDPKVLYSRAFHQPLTRLGKFKHWINSRFYV